MKYFACADIHGFFNEWIKALDEAGFDINNPNHKCVICGDLFDRGKQPQQIINYILSHKDSFLIIRGNHEDLLEDCISQLEQGVNISHHHWLNGTLETIGQLSNTNKFDLVSGVYNYKEIKQSMKKYFELISNAKDFIETNNYIFVHGWIPVIENPYQYDKYWRNAKPEMWNKARWQNPIEMYKNEVYEPNKIIVCGHWHCSALWHEQNPELYEEFGEKANFRPFIIDKMIALDACTIHSKKVNVVVLED